MSAVYAVVQALFGGGLPANEGFYRPISCTVPDGTILNPRRPAARGARGIVAFRLIDAMFGAFHQLLPDRIPAAGDGSPSAIAIGAVVNGKSMVTWDVLNGAWGARPDQDGLDGASQIGANLANTPVEEIERRHIIRIDGYGYLPDTGGPGQWRGGLSTFREMTLLVDEASLQIRSDRRLHPPYGLAGAGPGGPSLNILNPGPDEVLLPSKPSVVWTGGDRHRHVTAGGGGFGDPFDRDPERVRLDVAEQKVTHEHAAAAYGVVIDGDEVDLAATEAERSRRRSTAGRPVVTGQKRTG
jgi:N-methylhydantoinase B